MPHSFTGRSRWKAVIPVFVFLAVLGAYPGHAHVQQGRLDRLKEIHSGAAELLRACTADTKAQRYPPMATGEKIFQPDLGFCPDLRTTYPNGAAIADYLAGKAGVEVCYLGYLTVNQRMGLAALDAFERDGAEAVREADIDLHGERIPFLGIPPTADAFVESIFRLHDGVERWLITDIGNPFAAEEMARRVPVLWEMPDRRKHPGGWVVFKDGHSEWYPYPGPFPMTSTMIKRIRSMMPSRPGTGIVPVDGPRLLPTAAPESPVIEIAEALVDTVGPSSLVPALHCDTEPSIHVDGIDGFRVDANGVYFLFPVDGGTPTSYMQRDDTVYLGEGKGYLWFAQCPLALPPDGEISQDALIQAHRAMVQLRMANDVRDRFGLRNGCDRLGLFKRAFGVERAWYPVQKDAPDTAEYCQESVSLYLLGHLGVQAVSFLEQKAANDPSAFIRANATAVLSQMDCPEAGEVVSAILDSSHPNALETAGAVILWLNRGRYGKWTVPSDRAVALARDALVGSGNRQEAARIAAEIAALACDNHAKSMRWGHPEEIGREVLRTFPPEIARPCIEAAIANLTPEQQEKVRVFLQGAA